MDDQSATERLHSASLILIFAWHKEQETRPVMVHQKNSPQILHQQIILRANVTHIVTLPFICHLHPLLIILNHSASTPSNIYIRSSTFLHCCTWDWCITDKCLLTKSNALEQLELLANCSLMRHPVPWGLNMFGQQVSRIDMARWGRNMQLKNLLVWCPWFMSMPIRITSWIKGC